MPATLVAHQQLRKCMCVCVLMQVYICVSAQFGMDLCACAAVLTTVMVC